MKPNANQIFGQALSGFPKKLLFLPLFFLMIVLTAISCRDDDNKQEQVDMQNLIGLWQPYKFTQTATLSTGAYNQTTDYTVCQQKSRIIFSENNVGTAKVFGEENGSCVLQNTDNFTYDYNPGTKTLSVTSSDGSKQTGTVLKISTSDLVYELTGTYNFEGETNIAVKTTIYARKTKD